MLKINVILGSTRPERFGIQPAEWIMNLSKQFGEQAEFELIDLKEINLPLLDLPVPPSLMPSNQNEHQTAWAKIIGEADGFVFVTGEYNHSIPAALKNALDYVYHEWGHKPVAFVSYGADAGGMRAIEHLRQVVAWLKMYDLADFIAFPQYYTRMDEQGKFQFSEENESRAVSMLTDLVFWAGNMKEARAKLAAQAQQ